MILQYPHETLKTKTKDLDSIALSTFLPHFKKLVKEVEDKALGLAAPQTGLSYSLVWIKDFGYMANPRIVDFSKEKTGSAESCLSVNGKVYLVERFKEVLVLYRNEKFKLCRKKFSGKQAIIVQHELNHLEGLCLPDVGKEIKSIEED